MNRTWGMIGYVIACLLGLPAHAADSCDRECLRKVADKLVESMVAHDVKRLPMAPQYMATENSAPSAVGMMTLWRTATAAKNAYYVIDQVSSQLFLIATVDEGGNDALFYGRIKVAGRLITELELFANRSRGQSGFVFSPLGRSNFPDAWTVSVAASRRSSRATLLEAGRSIFDTSVNAPEISAGCLLMENGKLVEENADVAKSVVPPGTESNKPIATNSNGKVFIPCGNPPIRPTDRRARTEIVDEELGVVVSLATVHGVVEPYLATEPTESAFVPDSMLQPYEELLTQQQATGRSRTPALRPMPATQSVAQLHRIYDGKLQGMMMLQSTGAPGSHSPWVAAQ